jgi:hypothetical protein
MHGARKPLSRNFVTFNESNQALGVSFTPLKIASYNNTFGREKSNHLIKLDKYIKSCLVAELMKLLNYAQFVSCRIYISLYMNSLEAMQLAAERVQSQLQGAHDSNSSLE